MPCNWIWPPFLRQRQTPWLDLWHVGFVDPQIIYGSLWEDQVIEVDNDDEAVAGPEDAYPIMIWPALPEGSWDQVAHKQLNTQATDGPVSRWQM